MKKKNIITGNITGNVTSNNENPGFFSYIPAVVLYDSSLPVGAKLLYAQITGLASKTGYCWASNGYLARLNNVSERTIGYWLVELHNAGYIILSYVYHENSRKIKQRRIRLPEPVAAVVEKLPEPEPEAQDEAAPEPETGVQDAQNSENDTKSGVATDCKTPDVVLQKTAPSSVAMDCGDNNINLNIINAAAAVIPPKSGVATDCKTPDVVSQPIAVPGVTGDIKVSFAEIDPELIFLPSFYQKAASYLSDHRLSLSYVSWILDKARRKKPNDLRAMFVTLFFAPDMTELFTASHRPPEKTEPRMTACPVCGASHDSLLAECPSCGLKSGAGADDLRFHRHLHALSPERRDEYEKQAGQIFLSGDFISQQRRFAALRDEFGFPK